MKKSTPTRFGYVEVQVEIAVKPGPGIVDPTKTIAPPYSQGNVEVFGTANAGTQPVAMSVSALV